MPCGRRGSPGGRRCQAGGAGYLGRRWGGSGEAEETTGDDHKGNLTPGTVL